MISLRQRVARWLLPPLIGLLLLNAWYGQRSARDAVNKAYDRGLTASAQLIAERTYSSHGEVVVDLPYAALDVSNERVFYGVFWPDGEVITGYEDLPHPSPTNDAVVVRDATYRGEPVRLVMMRKPLYDPEQANATSVHVIVAETVDGRSSLAREIFVDGLRSQGLLLAVGLLLLWVVITRALQPMTRLGEAFARRRDEDLTPVESPGIPSEVKPLIDAVNHHMHRIEAMMQARKRFVADAAHQLRTPLVVLRTQVDYGLRQADPLESRAALEGVGHSVRHMHRLTDQLLSLSSAEAINGLARQRADVNLQALAQTVLMDLMPLALSRQIDLGFEPASSDPGPVWGHEALLREMLSNLVDNALRYTELGGEVTVQLSVEPGAVLLTVTDTGPGIPVEERAKVFHRFYRILGRARTDGSGLGLAIVREIVSAHAGQVSLHDGPGGVGLSVQVRLPVAR